MNITQDKLCHYRKTNMMKKLMNDEVKINESIKIIVEKHV